MYAVSVIIHCPSCENTYEVLVVPVTGGGKFVKRRPRKGGKTVCTRCLAPLEFIDDELNTRVITEEEIAAMDPEDKLNLHVTRECARRARDRYNRTKMENKPEDDSAPESLLDKLAAMMASVKIARKAFGMDEKSKEE